MQQFFGHPESPLFGVHHAPRGQRDSGGRAVVICPPVGQEYIRTHWCLRLLANQIARSGAHTLRLDYQAVGDSAGRIEDIYSIDVWKNDVVRAIEHLKQLADVDSVMLIGQRLGGTIAAQVAMERPDVNSVVLWEPVLSGSDYLDQLRAVHATMLDLWVCKMQTPNDDSHEEILGSLFTRNLLDEIGSTQLDLGNICQPQLVVECQSAGRTICHPEPSLQKVIFDERDPSWGELKELESAYLRPEMTRRIVKLVGEMFDRLDRFGVLMPPVMEAQA